MVFSMNCKVFAIFVVLTFIYADLNTTNNVSEQDEAHWFITVQCYFSKTE